MTLSALKRRQTCGKRSKVLTTDCVNVNKRFAIVCEQEQCQSLKLRYLFIFCPVNNIRFSFLKDYFLEKINFSEVFDHWNQ